MRRDALSRLTALAAAVVLVAGALAIGIFVAELASGSVGARATIGAAAGIALIETGSGSDHDLLTALDQVLPTDDRWRQRHGSRGHGRDHVVPAFVAPYATVPVLGGRLALGTWQSICLVDLNVDNADREVRLSFLS